MDHQLNSQSVDFYCIDFADHSYSISPDKKILSDNSLAGSISRYGILRPPIVKEKEHGSYAIVAGRKRLALCKNIFPEKSHITCLVIPARSPEIDIFSIMLEEKCTRRKLTPVEKALLLQKVSSLTDDSTVAKLFLPRIDLPPDPNYIKRTVKILNLEKSIIDAIHLGHINEKTANEFLTLSTADRLALIHVMIPLQPSANYQKKMVSICKELAGRADKTITEILKCREISEITDHPNANPPQKLKNLMHYLDRKHKPRKSLAEDEFKSFTAGMRLPGNVSIEHSQSFEDDSVTLSIKFPNKESIRNAWKEIRDAVGKQGN